MNGGLCNALVGNKKAFGLELLFVVVPNINLHLFTNLNPLLFTNLNPHRFTNLDLLLSSFLASISPLKRNIFTYLDKLFLRVAFIRVVILVRRPFWM